MDESTLVKRPSIDGTKGGATATATATVQLDNDRMRVTEWRFGPDGEAGLHVHPFDYVVVPLTTATPRLELADETLDSELTTGIWYT